MFDGFSVVFVDGCVGFCVDAIYEFLRKVFVFECQSFEFVVGGSIFERDTCVELSFEYVVGGGCDGMCGCEYDECA